MSKEEELPDEYTNHRIQTTCIHALDQEGCEARHIISLSNQKRKPSGFWHR